MSAHNATNSHNVRLDLASAPGHQPGALLLTSAGVDLARHLMLHVYLLDHSQLRLLDLTGPTLDAVSLQLPEGAYTTLRTFDRERIIGLSAHLQRLVDSHALAGRGRALDLPAIRSALRAVLAREGLDAARLRLTTPFDGERVYISIEPFDAYPPKCYACGVRCNTTRLSRDIPRAKLTDFIAPSRAARAEGDPEIHELLLVDAGGRILEGTSSNFFAVLDGILRTAGEGVLEGVTRGLVLAEAEEIVPIVLDAIVVADLPRLSEALITSSSRDVMPVIQIDQARIGSGEPGPMTRALMARYRARLIEASENP